MREMKANLWRRALWLLGVLSSFAAIHADASSLEPAVLKRLRAELELTSLEMLLRNRQRDLWEWERVQRQGAGVRLYERIPLGLEKGRLIREVRSALEAHSIHLSSWSWGRRVPRTLGLSRGGGAEEIRFRVILETSAPADHVRQKVFSLPTQLLRWVEIRSLVPKEGKRSTWWLEGSAFCFRKNISLESQYFPRLSRLTPVGSAQKERFAKLRAQRSEIQSAALLRSAIELERRRLAFYRLRIGDSKTD